MNEPRWAQLAARVTVRQVTVSNAAALVELHERVHRVADPTRLDDVLEHLTGEAATLHPEELARRVPAETEQLTPPRDAERIEQARRGSAACGSRRRTARGW